MRISTIIPAYNRAELIGETLRTVLSQSRPPDEIIVVDDGSSDGTADVVAGVGKDVLLIRQANTGASAARNAGFARSTGEIVHFMDSDDLCSLNFYAAAARHIEEGAGMTYGPWLKARFEDRHLHPEPVVLQQRPVPGNRPMDVLALLVDWVTVFQPCLFRREAIEQAGPFRTDLQIGEDIELMYRLLHGGTTARHVPETLVLYRVHPENQLSERGFEQTTRGLAELWAVLRQHADARCDLGPAARRAFRRKLLDVSRDLEKVDRDAAAAFAAQASFLDRAIRPFNWAAAKGREKLRSWTIGNRYAAALSPGPLRDDQRVLVAELGYALG